MTRNTVNTAKRSAMSRRTFLNGALVAGSVLIGLGAVPLATCFSQWGAPVGAETAAPGVSCSSCDGSACADCPLAVATQSKPKVNASKCVGCTKCVRIADKTFAMDPKTEKAYVKNPTGDAPATIAKAAKACPTGAISYK